MPVFEGAAKLWVVHIGGSTEAALKARDEGFVCIGWHEMGDLGALTARDDFKARMRATYADWSDGQINTNAGQVFRFVRQVAVGDPVVLPVKPTSEIAIGRVSSEYRHVTNDAVLAKAEYPNVRSVEWLKIVPRTAFTQRALYAFGAFLTLSSADEFLEEVITILERPGLAEVAPEAPGEEAVGAPGSGAGQEDLYDQARQLTEDALLKQWQRSGADFEHVVAAVLEALGYTARVTRAVGDQGVDVIAHPDRLGLEKPYLKVQVKSGTGTVGGPAAQQLKGTLHPGEKGMLVSLGGFSRDAIAAERGSGDLVLIDAQEFVRLFLDVYENLDPKWRARFPLRRVYVPES